MAQALYALLSDVTGRSGAPHPFVSQALDHKTALVSVWPLSIWTLHFEFFSRERSTRRLPRQPGLRVEAAVEAGALGARAGHLFD